MALADNCLEGMEFGFREQCTASFQYAGSFAYGKGIRCAKGNDLMLYFNNCLPRVMTHYGNKGPTVLSKQCHAQAPFSNPNFSTSKKRIMLPGSETRLIEEWHMDIICGIIK